MADDWRSLDDLPPHEKPVEGLTDDGSTRIAEYWDVPSCLGEGDWVYAAISITDDATIVAWRDLPPDHPALQPQEPPFG